MQSSPGHDPPQRPPYCMARGAVCIPSPESVNVQAASGTSTKTASSWLRCTCMQKGTHRPLRRRIARAYTRHMNTQHGGGGGEKETHGPKTTNTTKKPIPVLANTVKCARARASTRASARARIHTNHTQQTNQQVQAKASHAQTQTALQTKITGKSLTHARAPAPDIPTGTTRTRTYATRNELNVARSGGHTTQPNETHAQTPPYTNQHAHPRVLGWLMNAPSVAEDSAKLADRMMPLYKLGAPRGHYFSGSTVVRKPSAKLNNSLPDVTNNNGGLGPYFSL